MRRWEGDGPGKSEDAPGHDGEARGKGNAYGWGMKRHSNTQSTAKEEYYTWDSENRLKEMVLNGRSMKYLYDESGTRTAKRGMRGETLYPNQYYQLQNQDEFVKHIFVGSTRISSALGSAEYYDYMYESSSIYYYHPDHLGSTTYVTDAYGDEFEHMEYTPYGELWIDEGSNKHLISYRFTGKELDEETGLYYYGARYLDPMTSRWISSDPSGSELMNPMDDEGKVKQGYYPVEAMNWFSYVNNNPLKYVDPNGNRSFTQSEISFVHEVLGNIGEFAIKGAHIEQTFMNRSSSFRTGLISLSDSIFNAPMDSNYGRNTFIHEVFHQVQYLLSPNSGLIPNLISGTGAWDKLAQEQILYSTGLDVYGPGDYYNADLSQYNELSDMPFLESQAQLVGDFADLYYRGKNDKYLSDYQKESLGEMARILSNSGFESEAIEWALNLE